ncbi:MAG TPA: phosphoribosylglycinamide formyltransferase [Frankiaceae bacterium]|nr:phosphoribosylglycinamide formyltransferase [Frankiaceae bacterium]
MPARLVVLASGTGSTLQAILDASHAPDFPARVVAVGTDRPGTLAETRAERAGIATWMVALADQPDRPAFDAAVAEQIAAAEPDLVVLAGYMKVLGPSVVGRFRIVNTHPSLLPAFPGAHAIRDALAYGVRVTGCTVHEVDEGVDTGPILAQAAVPVVDGDDEDSLRARIQATERVLYLQTIRDLCSEISRKPNEVLS